jgi:prophage regulatory protein
MADVETSTERLLKLSEVSARVGLGKTRIYAMIAVGTFPAPYKIGKASRWSEREVVAWIMEVKDGFEGKRRKLWA